jgi:hypothetical protein
MDKLTQFNQIVIDVLKEYKSQFRLTNQDIKNEIVIDENNHHYQFLWTGWRGEKHIFNVAFHIDIVDNKIWIQKDNTEVGIANLLVEKGISKEDIVLAYFPKAHRKYTEFAAA